MTLSEIPKKPGIYKLTNKINKKIYIGKSVNLHSRISTHKSARPKYYIDFAIKKYGFENFDIEIIHYYENPMDNTELIALETACIEAYNSLVPNGYNIMLFGNSNAGIKRSEETKRRLSLAKMGNKNPKFGVNLLKHFNRNNKGNNNGRFDYTIYTLKHRTNGSIFNGHIYDFYTQFQLKKSNVYAVIKGKQKSVKDWILVPN